MIEYARRRAEAAKWMYEQKVSPDHWWRSEVLTKRHTDTATLGLDHTTAVLIFADLVSEGLLVPIVASDGHEAFSINPGKDAEWKWMMSPIKYWLAHHTWQIFFWLISTICGGIVGIGIGMRWAQIIGE